MRVGVRFGQELKCPRFTARNSVEGFGLKAQACRYFYKWFFVFACRIMMFFCGCLKWKMGVLGVVFCSIPCIFKLIEVAPYQSIILLRKFD